MFLWGIRLILGITFIYASLHKILHPADFARIIYGYGIFPETLINILAIWVPFMELVGGVCLIFNLFPASALLIINGLLLGFILVIGFNLIRGHEFDCGCFSLADHSEPVSAVWLLVRDLVLLTAGTFLYRHLSVFSHSKDALRYR